MHKAGCRVVIIGVVMTLVLSALPWSATADHAWLDYHWARTANPFSVPLGDNLTGIWASSGHLQAAASDWSQSAVLDATITGGGGDCETPRQGLIEVCNGSYGNTGWLGLAQVWTTDDDHILQASAKMNDTYFSVAPYNTAAWRQSVMCQEIGHGFGLGHTDENQTNVNDGTCMDYTNDPDGGPGGASETDPNNLHPFQHDYDELASIYQHLDATTTTSGSVGATVTPTPTSTPTPPTAPAGSNPSFPGGRLPVAKATSSVASTDPAQAHDGSTSTHWFTTGTTAPSSAVLTLDLGATRQLSGVKWTYRLPEMDKMTLQVSADGTTWTAVGTTTARAQGTWEGAGTTARARYDRLVFDNPSLRTRLGFVSEVQVWGTAVATPAPESSPVDRAVQDVWTRPGMELPTTA